MGDDDIHYMIKYTTQNSITGHDISLKSQKKKKREREGGGSLKGDQGFFLGTYRFYISLAQ